MKRKAPKQPAHAEPIATSYLFKLANDMAESHPETARTLIEAANRIDELEEAQADADRLGAEVEELECVVAEAQDAAEANQAIVDAAYSFMYHNTQADRDALQRALEDAGYMYLTRNTPC